jgi:GT2 family glycosyltransferase
MTNQPNTEEVAPPVVAVVVASDPGPWFEQCLEALGGQDYPNLDVLVVDAASKQELTARVAAVLPRAFILRQAESYGYSAAANEALSAVQGASHLVFCHDDIAPEPDALRHLVGEAYRSNAGIVGPKVVDWDAPDRLLEVGLGVDRFGVAVDRIEPGELDQAQHDEVREVFAVPGGCMLVRADLFNALGGFDPDINLFGEDVDLCWRARVAGARVVVAPAARVRHIQSAWTGSRPIGDVAGLRRRHELRSVLKNYNRSRRLLVAVDLLAGSGVEMVLAYVRGDRERARRVRDAWRWNWRHRRSGKIAHQAVTKLRQQSDRDIARLLAKGGRRSALRASRLEPDAPARQSAVGSEDVFGSDESLEPDVASLRPKTLRGSRHVRVGWWMAVCLVVVLFAIRDLIPGHLPLVGQLLAFPAPSELLREFFGGWRDANWQATGPAPTGFGLVGLAGAILLGSTAQVGKLLLLAPIFVGAIGMYRLLRPFGSRRAQVVGMVAFLGLPLVWNDISAGNIEALVCLAGMPFVMARMCRATRLAPFASPGETGDWRSVLGEIVPFGLLLAVMVALAPQCALAVMALGVGIVVGSIAARRPGAALRSLGITLGALCVALVCCIPWSLTFFQNGARWSIIAGAVGSRASVVGILRMFRFDLGPIGAGWLGWGIPVGAAFVLFVARDERLDWATRWWMAAVLSVGVAYLGAIGRLGSGGGATMVFVAPAACCLAGAVGLGVAAFEVDLAKSRYGWRQNLSVVAAACCVVGLFPVLVSSLNGRSLLPSAGYDQILSWTATGARTNGYEVLWLGDPSSVPSPSWQVRPGLVFAVSMDGLPDGRRLWPSANPGLGAQVEVDLVSAEQGRVVGLGAEFARAGIRYVVLPDGAAPALPGVQASSSARFGVGLLRVLEMQSDLRELPAEGGVAAFENTAWTSKASATVLASKRSQTPSWLRELGVAGGLLVVVLAIAEGVFRRRRRGRPPRPDASVVGGDPCPPSEASSPADSSLGADEGSEPKGGVDQPAATETPAVSS